VEVGLGIIRKTIESPVREAVDLVEAGQGTDTDLVSYQLFAILQGVNVRARAGGRRIEFRQLLRRTVDSALSNGAIAMQSYGDQSAA